MMRLRHVLWLAWWNVRFFACAFVQLPFEHPRVQRLVSEHFARTVL